MTRHIGVSLACLVCIVALMLSSFPTTNSFLLLDGSRKYIAQVKVFMDYAAKQKWYSQSGKTGDKQLKADMQALIDEVNSIYRGLEPYDMDLQIEIKDVVIVKYYDKIITPSVDYKISPNTALHQFRGWIARRYHKQDFDFALLFTGASFYVGVSRTHGVAYTGSVCSVYGLGLLEMFGKLSTDGTPNDLARYAAHEIGHILGANHDEGSSCSDKKGHIMTSYALPDDVNKFNFTQCTFKDIKNVIKTLTDKGNNCLLPGDTGLTAADKACQDREGSDKWFMSRNYKEYGDTMCGNLKCIAWNGQKRVFTQGKPAPDGLDCGMNKRCQKGKCVYDVDGDRYMSDSCPWGNQDLHAIGYRNSCESQDCEGGWKNYCCAHCSALAKEIEQAQG